ncbi:peptidoglycan-binding protein [Sorangium sp. So ce321]|uniref:peptidoglycan-binding protein n=1 Tax=Sorangium sp. So ce321 TaxID=3133300 RepID=UPI003F5EAD7D
MLHLRKDQLAALAMARRRQQDERTGADEPGTPGDAPAPPAGELVLGCPRPGRLTRAARLAARQELLARLRPALDLPVYPAAVAPPARAEVPPAPAPGARATTPAPAARATTAGAPEKGAGSPPREKLALEVVVLDERDQPLSGASVELRNGKGQVLYERTGRDGQVRFEGLEDEPLTICLHELDEDAWVRIRQATLPDPKSRDQASWKSAWAQGGASSCHVVVEGDCISSIADRHGFFPETLWSIPDNALLRRLRRSKNVLNPGDRVIIPARRRRAEPARAGWRHWLRRKGWPEILRIRFLTFGDEPRKGEPYVLSLTAAGGRKIEDRAGHTDGDGFLIESIPPDAATGRILLGAGEDQEEHELRLGCLDPADTVRGAQARLNNLGYPCGEEDGALGDLTRAALKRFQRARGLEITGEIDAATQAELLARHLS